MRATLRRVMLRIDEHFPLPDFTCKSSHRSGRSESKIANSNLFRVDWWCLAARNSRGSIMIVRRRLMLLAILKGCDKAIAQGTPTMTNN
jgi:hypothetical protein